MHVVVVTEKDGKIELTKDELQKMLDESYSNGYSKGYTDGYQTTITTTPNHPYNPIWTITTTSSKDYEVHYGSYCTCNDTEV